MSLSSKHYRMDKFKVQIAFTVPISKDTFEPIAEQKFGKSEKAFWLCQYITVQVKDLL